MSQAVNPTSPVRQDAAHPELAAVPDAPMWALYAGQWRRQLAARNVAPLTVTAYLASLRALQRWSLTVAEPPILTPEELGKTDVQAFFAWALTRTTRRGTKASPSAVARDYRQLKVFFK